MRRNKYMKETRAKAQPLYNVTISLCGITDEKISIVVFSIKNNNLNLKFQRGEVK